jgi:hypothetical protein
VNRLDEYGIEPLDEEPANDTVATAQAWRLGRGALLLVVVGFGIWAWAWAAWIE